MSNVKFVIETTTEKLEMDNEKVANNRLKDLRRQELDVFLIKEVYNKKGKLVETYLVG